MLVNAYFFLSFFAFSFAVLWLLLISISASTAATAKIVFWYGPTKWRSPELLVYSASSGALLNILIPKKNSKNPRTKLVNRESTVLWCVTFAVASTTTTGANVITKWTAIRMNVLESKSEFGNKPIIHWLSNWSSITPAKTAMIAMPALVRRSITTKTTQIASTKAIRSTIMLMVTYVRS